MNIKKSIQTRMNNHRGRINGFYAAALFFSAALMASDVAIAGADFPPEEKPPKNIILYIGDGMGIGQITALLVARKNSNFNRFKIGGLLGSHPLDSFQPCTESGTTALATGVVSNYNSISLSTDDKPLKTVLEYARDNGKSTGIVVTSEATDTTPACFAAHVKKRGLHQKIAEEMADSNINVIFGGGLEYFTLNTTGKGPASSKTPFAKLNSRYPVITTIDEFRKLNSPDGAYALLALKSMPPASKRDLLLSEMATKAIDILSKNENGFFLMVEGSQIDWATHHGDTGELIDEMEDFDGAIGVGLDFAEKNADTLVIVASDHDTRGYCVIDGSFKTGLVKMVAYLSDDHSANLIPFFAYGPGSSVLGGIHTNEFVGETMIKYVKEKSPSR